MNRMNDWRDLLLAPGGRSLVEASAGTGKTWTIGVLYLRLLLEQQLSPRQIVVATYTNAAAAELVERLRARLHASLLHATHLARADADTLAEPPADASDQHWLHARWRDAALREADAQRLALALAELDLAPIGTLHSLCTRILAEHPFAAGASFQTPALVDSKALRIQLADDLWRLLHGEPDTLQEDAQAAWQAARPLVASLKRDTLAKWLHSLLLPGVVVPKIDDAPPQDCAAWATELDAAVERTEVFARKNAALRTRWTELAAFLHGWAKGEPDWSLPPSSEVLEKRLSDLNQDFKPTFHDDANVLSAIALCRKASATIDLARHATLATFLSAIQHWAQQQMAHRLSAANQLGFDDLLTTVHAALATDENGQRVLSDALFAAWPVALIDEFQDTDPVQYGILDAIYSDAEGQPRGRLLMIGDPKQAIYRFRGGDIQTYQRAAQSAGDANTLRLGVNRRSSKACVDAVNAFYARVGETLGATASSTPIRYVEVEAAPDAATVRYTSDGQAADALVLYSHDDEQDADEYAALRSCAGQIASMLAPDSSYRVEGRALRASDVCVLLPNNQQTQQMVELLRERNIATVNRGRGSVLESDTARDLLLILDAVSQCDDARRIRAALATPLWGMGYHALRALQHDEAEWQEHVARFHRWHHDWLHNGVLAVITAVMQQIATQQLGTLQGERVLTDLRHLGELLQDASDTCDGMVSLLTWLREQQDGGDGDEDAADARGLRLESDADCAQVMTLHASKGLEFNLVFLPLMWKHKAKQDSGLALVGRSDGTREVALSDAHRERAAMEEQDERFRVLYVALTRARHANHVWLPPEKGQPGDTRAAPMTLAALALRLPARHENTAAESAGISGSFVVTGPDMDNAATPSAPATSASRAPATQTHPALILKNGWPIPDFRRLPPALAHQTRQPARALPPERAGDLPTRHSFTTLVAGAWQGALHPVGVNPVGVNPEAAAGDESDQVVIVPATDAATTDPANPGTITRHAELDALYGVAGTGFGNAVHAILELRRIGQPIRQQTALVSAQLDAFNVRDKRIEHDLLTQHLAARLDAVLDAAIDAESLRLAALPAPDIRNEMEFHYALDGASLMRLRDACAKAGHPDMIPARHQHLHGLMNGKIDLVFHHDGRFHVLDWKGNRLGLRDQMGLEDYAPAALEAAMDAHHYRFQALLYAVAVERYLRSRLGHAYERSRHLGDCWYLFIRATGLLLPDGTPCGIWRHRFPDALLDAVQQELSTQQVEAA